MLNRLPVYITSKSGVVIQPQTLQRVSTNYVRKLGSYILIPGFSIDATWRGASEIIATFHYWSDTNNALRSLPTPSDPNFVACIAWRVSEGVMARYKLWKNVGELLYVPDYEGQTATDNHIIIEIWNTPESPAISIDELIYTSKMFIPTDFCSDADIELDWNRIQCVDPVFDLSDFVPAAGDYYTITQEEGACPVVTLVKAATVGTYFLLRSEDDLTWHKMYILRVSADDVTYGIDPTPEAAGVSPYVPFLIDGVIHKLNLRQDGTGGYTFTLEDTVAVDAAAQTTYLITDPNTGFEHFVRGTSDLTLDIGQIDL